MTSPGRHIYLSGAVRLHPPDIAISLADRMSDPASLFAVMSVIGS